VGEGIDEGLGTFGYAGGGHGAWFDGEIGVVVEEMCLESARPREDEDGEVRRKNR